MVDPTDESERGQHERTAWHNPPPSGSGEPQRGPGNELLELLERRLKELETQGAAQLEPTGTPARAPVPGTDEYYEQFGAEIERRPIGGGGIRRR